MRKILAYIVMSTLIAMNIGCAQTDITKDEPEIARAQPNPNGDTELALLMRDLFDECMDIKKAIAIGEDYNSKLDLELLYTKDATDTVKVASEAYKVHARTMELTWEALMTSDAQGAEDAYNAMVATCKACHTALCPGPLVRIAHLEE